jgi:hypothetical protein
MVVDLETRLRLLARKRPNADLAGFEHRVLAAIRQRQGPSATRVTAIFASLALFMGIGAALVPGNGAHSTNVAPFGAPSALAPSTLLLSGGR